MDIREIAESFSRHNFSEVYPHMSDDIVWTMVGAEELVGKEKVMELCEESASYLSDIRVNFNSFRTIVADENVVIDSRADYIDSDDDVSSIASCDIFEFQGGKLVSVTSYGFEL